MSRKVDRVRFKLDPGDVESLSGKEIAAILRGADDLIMSGGRTMLAKILKGSRDKRLLELGLDKSPVYGFYSQLPINLIQHRVDWVILEGYLKIEYDHRLPLLVYTPRGWEIEMETYADELLKGFDDMLASGADRFNMRYLVDRNRPMILRLLEKVEDSGNKAYIPILKDWQMVDYKKVRKRIQRAIDSLNRS